MARKSSCLITLCLALAPVATVVAQVTGVDLADKPMASGTSGEVKPNVMIVLDDSGSMTWTYMPDEAVSFHGSYGYASSQCNAVYYDPDVIYEPPVKADGSLYADAKFTSARDDGFNTSSTKRNLDSNFFPNRFTPESANDTYNSTSYKPYKKSALDADGAAVSGSASGVPAFYYLYTGSQTRKDYINTSSTFYEECNSKIGSTPGKSRFE